MVGQDPAKIFLAAIVGFTLGILFAPRSGRETREQWRHKSEEAQRRAKLVATDVRDQVKEAAAGTRRRGKELKDDVTADVKGEKA